MADPTRLKILKAITAALLEIAPANGYVTDLATKKAVFRGRIIFGEKDPLPMVSLLEVPIPSDQIVNPKDGTAAHATWDLLVQGFVQDDKSHPTDPAHAVLADVKKRLVIEKRRVNSAAGAFGFPIITDVTIGPGTIRPPDELSSKAYFWLALTINFAEDLFDPYS